MLEPSEYLLLLNGFIETIYMTFVSGFFGFLIGLPLGILLFLTGENQYGENRVVNLILAFVINAFRSIPFIIFIVWLIPFTRAIVGTSIGVHAALVPLSIGVAPFIARMVENSLKEVPKHLIEAIISLGVSKFQLVWRVLLPEALPSLITNATITLVTLVGFSAMGGAVGAGGLGQIGYQYGYIGYDLVIMNVVILLLITIVLGIQWLGQIVSKKVDKR